MPNTELLTIKLKKKRKVTPKVEKVKVSSDVYSVLSLYAKETGITIENLTDILLKYALDNLEVIYEEEENEVV